MTNPLKAPFLYSYYHYRCFDLEGNSHEGAFLILGTKSNHWELDLAKRKTDCFTIVITLKIQAATTLCTEGLLLLFEFRTYPFFSTPLK
jgi:hypothetical protein